MRNGRQNKQGRRSINVQDLRAIILGVNTNSTPTVKKSISIPENLYVFALKRAKQQGHNNVSRVVREAVERLRMERRAA